MNSRVISNCYKTIEFPPVNTSEEKELQWKNAIAKIPEGVWFVEIITECMGSVRDKYKESKKEVDRIEMTQINLAVRWMLEIRDDLRKSGIRDNMLVNKLTFVKLSNYINCLMKINCKANLMYKTTKIQSYQINYKGTAAAIVKLIALHQEMEKQ